MPQDYTACSQNARLKPAPPVEQWDDWVEYDAAHWPRKVERHYSVVPSLCFNCEAGCGILAYVDRDTLEVSKVSGNPFHPASRGRLCAKGSAIPAQVADAQRILYPMKREGRRGEGKWRRVSWDEALTDIASRVRAALEQGRRNEIMYHVGRPGEDGFVNRVLAAWGVDGQNSHTNVCSSSARLGHFLWSGYDRPSPDFSNARVLLLLSSHLESGHYHNPHAQRIMEARERGAKLIVLDPRLSNTAAKADYWLPARSGTEGAVLLAIARLLLEAGRYDAEFLRRWVNWQEYLEEEHPEVEITFDNFIAKLKQTYARFTPEYAAEESGVAAELVREAARQIGEAGSRLSVLNWRGPASGNLWGWQVTRCLVFLAVLMGAIGTKGGLHFHAWHKFVPRHPNPAPPPEQWNELSWPRDFPLSCYEMSFLLPHFLKEGRGKLSVYFTRVYNPIWTNPDGLSWMEVLQDESLIGLHLALTPTWSETAWFADYVLPMGLSVERHDNQSQETHPARWVGFRQPVRRVALARQGKKVEYSYQANPGEVWEEDEFWIELSWRFDPDGQLGIRKHFESPYRPGHKIEVEEYYRWMFENGVPGLPQAAAAEGLAPLEYMQRYGVFVVEPDLQANQPFARELPAEELTGATRSGELLLREGRAVGLLMEGKTVNGFPTPSRRLEFFSKTLGQWGWGEHAIPGYHPSQVYWRDLKREENEFDLLPNFRLPTLIHSRSAVKWLYEISHLNPVWLNAEDAQRLGVKTGDLLKVHTAIGYFVDRAWVTESIRPGVIAVSHHLGRWYLDEPGAVSHFAAAPARLEPRGDGEYLLRYTRTARPVPSADPDSKLIWWKEVGVNQNLAFPVQPDPVSGMHCWHQRVRVARAGADDRYGDVFVSTRKAGEVFRHWLGLTRPAPEPAGLRRPLWFDRPLRPAAKAYYI